MLAIHVRDLEGGADAVIYLSEREVGFDPELIGFPSIDACLAIVYVTAGGLFGFHNFGGSARERWQSRAEAFRDFVGSHDLPGKAGRRLYGATYVESRGYASPEDWKEELKTFALVLGFSGKIRGFDLGQTGVANGAYVEFRKTEEKCEVWVETWADVRRSTGANENPLDHKIIATRSGGVTTVENTSTNVVDYARALSPIRVRSSRISIL